MFLSMLSRIEVSRRYTMSLRVRRDSALKSEY